MIFKTFDSNVDKWTTKIGTFGMSFQNLGTTISTSFQRAKDAAENSENSAGFFQTFKDSLLSSTVNGQDYKRNKVGEIVTLENIDTYIPTLDIENRENKLADIKDIRNGNKTKYDFYSSLKPGEDYLRNLIENTEDLSTLTGDDLVEANEKARASVLSQNEALKQQSIAAKTSKMAFQALATAGGMVAGFSSFQIFYLVFIVCYIFPCFFVCILHVVADFLMSKKLLCLHQTVDALSDFIYTAGKPGDFVAIFVYGVADGWEGFCELVA